MAGGLRPERRRYAAYLSVYSDFGDLGKDSGPRPLLALICKAREKAWGNAGDLSFCSTMETLYRRYGENMPLDEQKLNGLRNIAAGVPNPNPPTPTRRRLTPMVKTEQQLDALLAPPPAPEVVTELQDDRHCNTCNERLVQRLGERHDRFLQRTTCGLSCGRIYGGRKGSRGPRELAEVAIAFVMTVTQRAWEASTFIAPPARAKLMAGR